MEYGKKTENISTGAIITSNHFNPFECFTVEYIFRNQEANKSKVLYKVIREGNYTNFPGFYGYLFKNCYTLPLSSNHQTMKKVEILEMSTVGRGIRQEN